MELLTNVSLAEFTSFKIGGKADYLCRVKSVEELQEALAFARQYEGGLPIFILGGGTNMLMSDDGFRGVVVKMEIQGITSIPPLREVSRQKSGRRMFVGAGEEWDAFVAETVMRGWWGLENLSGIPGTVGGAPVQNIGAYGVEVAEVLEWVEVLDTRTNTIRQLSNAECQFGYRDSIFKKPEGKHFVITRVSFCLRSDGAPNLSYKDLAEHFSVRIPSSVEPARQSAGGEGSPITIGGGGGVSLAEVRRAVLEIRSRKFPDLQTHGTAGSFFKNPIVSKEKFEKLKKKYPNLPGFPVERDPRCLPPINIGGQDWVKIPLAWILDKICNLKGFEQGKAALWKDQPLVLVNTGGATASAVSALADDVARIVKEKTGIEIEKEIQYIK